MKAISSGFFNRHAAVLLVVSGLLTTGCSINMKHEELAKAPRQFSDQINISKRSEGIEGRVGWGRITVFAIPVVPIYINGEGNELVMKQIQDALKQVGYQVATVESEKSANGPTLKCKVDEFSFSNYTWIFPLVPTWGDIKLTTNLVTPSGQVLWSQQFKGDGFTFNFFNGFTSAAEESMTEILDEMVKAFSSDAFHLALTQSHRDYGQGGTSAAPSGPTP